MSLIDTTEGHEINKSDGAWILTEAIDAKGKYVFGRSRARDGRVLADDVDDSACL
jgi:hypothetical protein